MSYNKFPGRSSPFVPNSVERDLDRMKKGVEAQSAPFDAYPSALFEARSVINNLKELTKSSGEIGDVVLPNFWIAGGALQSLIRSYPVNDYDIFTSDPQGMKIALDSIANLSDRLLTGHSNDNFTNYYLDGQQIQLITRFAPQNMHATIEMFDFTVVCAAYDGNQFVCHPRFYMDVASNTLVARSQEDLFPFVLSTMERVTKYVGKGYSLCPLLLKKIAKQINEMSIDWENPDEDLFTFYPDGTPRFTGVD